MKKGNNKSQKIKQRKAEKRNKSNKKREGLKTQRLDERNIFIKKKKLETLNFLRENLLKQFNEQVK